MSDNWVVQNLENALEVWNDKLSEIWQLITQSPQTFKGGSIWSIICSIHGALQAIGYALVFRSGSCENLRLLCRAEKAGARGEVVRPFCDC